MKRCLLTLFVLMLSGGLMANHWIPNSTSYEDNMTLTGVVQINGEEQETTSLEVGVFCGEECRGSQMLTYFPPTQRYLVMLIVYGESGDQLTFKLYDQEQGLELDLESPSAVTFTTNGYGALMNPYVLNFTGGYAITATPNPAEGGTVTGAGTYDHGATATLTATANDGYTFINWTQGGEVVSTNPTYSFTVTGDRVLVANFATNTNHWIPNSTSYEDNMTLTGVVQINGEEQETTSLEVGVFCGEECRGSQMLTYFPPTQRYLVMLIVYGESGDQLTFKLYDHEQGLELDLESPAAVTFTTNGYGALMNPYVLNFTGGYAVTATANPEAGGTVTGAGTYDHGATATLTATPNAGYTFLNWTQGGEIVSAEATYSFTVTEAATFVANFGLNSYAVTATANPEAGGTVTGAGTYDHGATATMTATANTGYTFLNWTQGGAVVSTNPTYSITVTGAMAFVANFELNSYAVTATANPEAGGTVEGAGTYDHGATATLTATANEGYTFINWTKNGSVASTNPTYSFTVTGAMAFVANFGLNSYAVTATANPEAGGTVTGAGTYDHGATATLTATANEGYAFINWTKNGSVVSTNPTYSFTVTEASAFVANFELNSYAITATANPETGGTVTGAGTYDHGATATLTATANEGYTFINWTKNGSVVSTNPTYSFTVTEDAALVANFSRVHHWTFNPAPYANNMNVLGMVAVNGEALESGYIEVGAFCGDECRGSEFVMQDGNQYLALMTIVGETGDLITFRAYDHQSHQEIEGTCTFSVTFEPDATIGMPPEDPVVFNFVTSVTQTTNFAAGWNWWSTYIDAGDVLTQLESGLTPNGQTIKSKSKSRVYRNGSWMGGLDAIESEGSYRVQTSAACTVDITGTATTPSAHPITLTPGWTWIGYPSTATMTVTEALANLTPTQGDVIKSKNKTAVYRNGAWMSSFTITPGTGLMYKSNAEGNVTLTYPSGAKGEAAVEESDNLHWTPNASAYPSNMTVIAVVELDGAELVTETTEGYELAAFADGECRGSFRLIPVEGRCMAILTVAGDEAAGLRFALYDAATGEEWHDATQSLDYETDAVVGDIDAPYVVRFRSAGVDEWESSLNVHPNPVGRGQKVSLGLDAGTTGKVQVEIINALGVVVATRRAATAQTEITAPGEAGVYTLRIAVEGKGACHRKLVVR